MSATATKLEDLKGRRGVDIGQSFIRAWNERTGKTTKRSKDYPNPEFYSLRYAFQPESIDNEGAGTLTPKATGEGHIYELERPCLNGGEPHRFTAVEQPSKEWECILLWDPDTQTLKLEKLESNLNVKLQKPGGSSNSSSRVKSKPAKASTSAPKDDKEFEDIERALAGDSDAEGEPDDDLIETLLDQVPKMLEVEEEEEEMESVEVEPSPAPTKVKATSKATSKAAPKAPKAAPKAKLKPRARTTATTSRRETEEGDADEEELNFGLPTKRSRSTNDSASSSSLANSGLALPVLPSQARHTQPTPSDLLQPPSIERMTYPDSSSDSDTDMHEVEVAPIEDETEAFGDVVDDFLNGMDARSDSGDDEGMEAVPISPEGGSTPTQSRPLTLNQIAGEDHLASDDDDDSSSGSDDSDDDD